MLSSVAIGCDKSPPTTPLADVNIEPRRPLRRLSLAAKSSLACTTAGSVRLGGSGGGGGGGGGGGIGAPPPNPGKILICVTFCKVDMELYRYSPFRG